MMRMFVHTARKSCVTTLCVGLATVGLFNGCANSSVRERTIAGTPSRESISQTKSSQKSNAIDSRGDAIRLVANTDILPEGDTEPVVDGLPPSPQRDAPNSSPIATSNGELSLAELESLALQNNPTLSQAQAGVEVEQGTYRQAGLYPNPQVGYLNGSASDPKVRQSNGVFISQEFVTAGKLNLDQQASAQEVKRLEWDREAQCMRVRNDLKIRYYEVLGAQEARDVAGRLVKIAEESLRATHRLFEAKQGTRSDILQATVQLESVRLSLDDAEYRYVAAWEQLATIVGMSPMQPVPLQGDLAEAIPELDMEACWQDLLAHSPQLRSVESELDHGRATYRLTRAQAIPNVTLQSVVEYDKATQATTASTLVAFPLPIYNRNQGNIDKAFADIQTDQAEIIRVRLVLRDQLADSFRRYKSSLRQTERLKQTILPSAEEHLALAKQLHAAGETAFTPVLVAQQTYFESQVAYVEAITELHKVITEIQGLQLTGGLNPAAIGSAIQNQPGSNAQRQRVLLKEVQDRAARQLLPAAQIGQ